MDGKILIVGLGNLGSVVLELLLRMPGHFEVVAATRNVLRGEARCNLARVGAIAQGFVSHVRHVAMDLNRIDEVAAVLSREKPDIVLNTATMQTWWLPSLLPMQAVRKLAPAGFGVWLPLHLAPSISLMKSVRASGFSGFVVGAPFPDVVNCVLGRIGLAPTCGVGNIDEIAAKVRAVAAGRLDSPLEMIEVSLVAHHALEKYVFAGDRRVDEKVPPWILQIRRAGKDAMAELDVRDVLFSSYPITEGLATNYLTAGSTVRLLRALLDETPVALHSPGPAGLPGGYPVRVSRSGVAVALGSIPLADALSVNEKSQVFDGIERIESDGTVALRQESAAVLRNELGYTGEQVKPESVQEQAMELAARLREYAKRHAMPVS